MDEAVKPIEYTQGRLNKMKREELEEIALGLNLRPHLMKNCETIVAAILNEQGTEPNALNPRQETFCQLYATDRDFFGNGTEAYIEAYDIKLGKPGAYDAARASASRLLTSANILSRINEIMETTALNDVAVDKQMAFWMTQKAHPLAAIAAIREYNKVKKRTDTHPALAPNLTQNNYTISIHDDQGRAIASKVTDYIMEITKAPQEGATQS